MIRRFCKAVQIKQLREDFSKQLRLPKLDGTQEEAKELCLLIQSYNQVPYLHNSKTWKDLEVAASRLQNQTAFCRVLHAFSKTQHGSSLFESFEPKALELIEQLDSLELAYLAKAYSSKQKGGALFYQAVSQKAKKDLLFLSPIDLSFLVNALLNIGYDCQDTLDKLLERASETLEGFQTTYLVQMTNGLCKVPKYHWFIVKCQPKMLESLSSLSQLDKIVLFKNMNLAQLADKHFNTEVCKAIKADLKTLPLDFTATLMNTLTLFPKHSKELLPEIQKHLKNKLSKKVDPKSLMLITRSANILGIGKESCTTLQEKVYEYLPGFTFKQLAHLVYTYGFTGVGSVKLWKAFRDRSLALIEDSDVDSLSLVVYALRNKGYLDQDFFKVAESKVFEKKGINKKTLEKLVCACSDFPDSKLFSELKEVFKQLYTSFPKNKALICINYFKEAGKMDSDLYWILKSIKTKA